MAVRLIAAAIDARAIKAKSCAPNTSAAIPPVARPSPGAALSTPLRSAPP